MAHPLAHPLCRPRCTGSVYKNGDVAYKHMVARQWGFGGAPMRT